MSLSRSPYSKFLEVLLFALLAAAFLQRVIDADIWFHLSIGKEIATTRAIPSNEFLVYPNLDLPGAFHEWGFGLLFYWVYEVAGFWGISGLNALLGALLFWLLFRASGARPLTNSLNLLVLLGVVVLVEFRLVYRAEIILYVALAAELLLLERFLTTRDWRWLAPIPLIALMLVQAHPSVVFMLAVLGGYGLQAVWDARGDKREAVRILGMFAACGFITVSAAVMNPYGIGQILLPFSFASDQRLLNMVLEFMPSLQSSLRWPFLLAIAVSTVVVALNRERRISDVLFLLVFGFLAYRHVRNISLLALLMYLPVTRGLNNLAGALVERWRSRSAVLDGAALARVFCALLTLAATGWFAARVLSPVWGAGPAPGLFPETVASMIESIQPPGQIFNHYETGGYLGWRLQGQYQVFIDGRHYKLNRSLSTHDAVMKARPGWQRGLDRYGVNIIVTQGTSTHQAQLIPLVSALAQDPAWGLVGRGERALLFFRKAGVIDYPDSFYHDKSEVWQQVKLEAESNIAAYPDQPLAYHALGEALARLGEPEQAANTLRHYLQLAPEDRDAAERLQQLEAEIRADRYNR